MKASFRQHTPRPLCSAIMLIGLAAPAVAQDSVTFAGWGGSFQDGLRATIFEPAAREAGVGVREDTTSGIQDVRAQMTANAVTWDVTTFPLDGCETLARQGMLEPLDYTVIDTTGIPAQFVTPYWVAYVNYSKVLAWQLDAYPDRQPQNWADFWDIETFPGPRAMFGSINDAMEAALLADGVPLDQVYAVLEGPGGVDRAFAKLEEIAPHVAVWYTGGSQAAQLMSDGEVNMIQMANNRAEAIIEGGAGIAYTFDEAALEADCLLVPKGAPNKEAAMRLIAFALQPEPQARMAQRLKMGPANARAFETGILSPEELEKVNTAPGNFERQLLIRHDFYVERQAELQERYDLLKQN